MVIERDNEQLDVPAEMRRRNAGIYCCDILQAWFLGSARKFLMIFALMFATFWEHVEIPALVK